MEKLVHVKNTFYTTTITVIIVSLIISLSLAVQITTSRQQSIQQINTGVANLSHTLDVYTEGIMRQSEMLITTISDVIDIYGMTPKQATHIQRIIENQDNLLTQINNVVIYNVHGDIFTALYGNFSGPRKGADRSFFIYHKENKNQQIFIGQPVVSRTNGKWVITISRRLETHTGDFNGVVVVTLGIENFLALYGQIDIGHSGVIGLTTQSGVLLVRYPFKNNYIGAIVSDSPLFRKYLKVQNSGIASSVSRFDKVERIFAFEKNKRYGLVTTVAVSKEEALSPWRKQAVQLAVLILIFTVALIVASYFLYSDLSRKTRDNKELKIIASEDALTGLYNRRTFDEKILSEIAACAANDTPISVLIVDVDYFKKYNDNYGHPEGDRCLTLLGNSLRESLTRDNQLVARYGGEEFALILPDTDIQEAIRLAQTMIGNVFSLDIEHAFSPFGRVTVSVGVSTARAVDIAGSQQNIIIAADQALYQAKRAGRNRHAFVAV
ncbi:sensor domain-containing diguanylate cyclase [Enterobacter cloacae]|uniref:sensor domain-containing diguanylate cyclase n=1 Tax=Enterobacter cloacae TaxID=550 RepID=UPI00396A73C0